MFSVSVPGAPPPRKREGEAEVRLDLLQEWSRLFLPSPSESTSPFTPPPSAPPPGSEGSDDEGTPDDTDATPPDAPDAGEMGEDGQAGEDAGQAPGEEHAADAPDAEGTAGDMGAPENQSASEGAEAASQADESASEADADDAAEGAEEASPGSESFEAAGEALTDDGENSDGNGEAADAPLVEGEEGEGEEGGEGDLGDPAEAEGEPAVSSDPDEHSESSEGIEDLEDVGDIEGSGSDDAVDDEAGGEESSGKESDSGQGSEGEVGDESPEVEGSEEDQDPSSTEARGGAKSKDTSASDGAEEDLFSTEEEPEPEVLDVEEPEVTPRRYEPQVDMDLVRAQRANAKIFSKPVPARQTRKPTTVDQSFLAALIMGLRKARWRAPRRKVVSRLTPPGRLNSREALKMTAQRSKGIPVTAQPFRQVVVKRAESPPIVLGMMCDVSGSMWDSVKPMALLTWACSQALPKVGGKFGAVTFGGSVTALARPGYPLGEVPIFKANSQYEAATEALLSLIGGLDLLGKQSAIKVVFIVSDSEWSSDEVKGSIHLLRRLEDAGVHIFWIPFNNNSLHCAFLEELPMFQVGTVVAAENYLDTPAELAKILLTKVKEG